MITTTKPVECETCGKKYTYVGYDGPNPGCRDWEYIYCPWCGKHDGQLRLNDGYVETTKVED